MDGGIGLLLARGRLGLVLLAVLAAAASAQELGPPGTRPCTCRAHGRSYGLGERVCLESPAGWRIAECRLAGNVTSWVFGPQSCHLDAALGLSPRAGSAAGPVAGSRRSGKGEG
ncbi:hypothetical protein [Benzoatithermus flavus]|jgi:hypothetical protein|uniref:Uncharacterized protein n=1 Tax=Benzoatithermus flavus TaxID=3108223 RepID=A0ABU8XWQ5_9PROT